MDLIRPRSPTWSHRPEELPAVLGVGSKVYNHAGPDPGSVDQDCFRNQFAVQSIFSIAFALHSMDRHQSNAVDALQVESWAGEIRVNLLRLALVLLFYGQHLVRYFVIGNDPALTPEFHARATALVLAWGVLTVVVHLLLDVSRARWWVKYATSLADAALITGMVCAAGDPRSPLVYLYVLLIVAAPLRLSLRLVYVVTLATMLGYLACVAFYASFQIGLDRYYAEADLRIPRGDQVLVLLVLVSTGLISGQVVRQMRRIGVDRAKRTGLTEAAS